MAIVLHPMIPHLIEDPYRDSQELMQRLTEEWIKQQEIGTRDPSRFRKGAMRQPKRLRIQAAAIELRDFAFQAAEDFHNSIIREQSVYYGLGYSSGDRVGKLHLHTNEQLNHKVFEVVRSAQTRLDMGSPTAFYESDDDNDSQWVGHAQDWLEMYEEADEEGEKQDTGTLQRLVGGNSVDKIGWNTLEDRLSDYNYSPISFAPDPQCTQIDLSDAGYVVETTRHIWWKLKSQLGQKFTRHFKQTSERFKTYKCDELWLRSHVAQELGIKTDFMMRLTLIDDKLVDIAPSPYWFPGFPYVCGRGFKIFDHSGMANRFWGFGYGKFLESQQKVLDETITQILLILQNQGLGQFLALKGVVDWKKARREPGLVLEVDPKSLGQRSIRDIIDQIPPSDVPASLFSFLGYIESAMSGNTGIDSDIFSGAQPTSSSGRAIGLLQSAASAQISDHQRSMIGVKKRMARRKLSMIQQFAKRPVKPNQWRHTSDLRDFPKQARYIGLKARIQDNSGLPHTPSGKIQMLLPLLEGGVISPETFFDITEIDRIYGIDKKSNTDQIMSQLQAQAQGVN